MTDKKIIFFFLFSCFAGLIYPADTLSLSGDGKTGIVSQVKNNDIFIKLFPPAIEKKNFPPKLFTIRQGRVTGELKIKKIFHSHIHAIRLSGNVSVGDTAAYSLSGTYLNWLNEKDIKQTYEKWFVSNRDYYSWQTGLGRILEGRGVYLKDEIKNREDIRNLFIEINETFKRDPLGNSWKKFFRAYLDFHLYQRKDHEQFFHTIIPDFSTESIYQKENRGNELITETAFLKARILISRKNYHRAAEILKTLLKGKREPAFIHIVLLNLAEIYYRTHYYDKAVKLISRAATIHPDYNYAEKPLILKYKCYIQTGDFEKALETLRTLIYNSTSKHFIAEALFYEYKLLKDDLNEPAMAKSVRETLIQNFPDSTFVRELDLIDARNELLQTGSLNALKTYKEAVINAPYSQFGRKAFGEMITFVLRLGRFEAAQNFTKLYTNTYGSQKSYPFYVKNAAALLTNLKIAKVNPDPKPGEIPEGHALFPLDTKGTALITNQIMVPPQTLMKAYELYAITNVKNYKPFSVINYHFAAILYYLNEIFKNSDYYEPHVLRNAVLTFIEFDNLFYKDIKSGLSPLLLSWAFQPGMPDKAREPLFWDQFQKHKNENHKTAYDAALEILKYKIDEKHVDLVFDWLRYIFKLETDFKQNELKLKEITDSYKKSDAHIEALAKIIRHMRDDKPVTEKRTYPKHAKLYNKQNDFTGFDLFKDLNNHKYRGDFLKIAINGPKPRIESRILALKPGKYRIMEITLHVPPESELTKGNLLWQTFSDITWNDEQSEHFIIRKPGTSVITIPLTHSSFRQTIKRFRINLYDDNATNPLHGSFLLKEIAIY